MPNWHGDVIPTCRIADKPVESALLYWAEPHQFNRRAWAALLFKYGDRHIQTAIQHLLYCDHHHDELMMMTISTVKSKLFRSAAPGCVQLPLRHLHAMYYSGRAFCSTRGSDWGVGKKLAFFFTPPPKHKCKRDLKVNIWLFVNLTSQLLAVRWKWSNTCAATWSFLYTPLSADPLSCSPTMFSALCVPLIKPGIGMVGAAGQREWRSENICSLISLSG